VTAGALAKAYQVKQVRNVIVQYRLAEEQDAEWSALRGDYLWFIRILRTSSQLIAT